VRDVKHADMTDRYLELCPRLCDIPVYIASFCPSTDCTTCSLQHVWFSCLRFCRSKSLELAAWVFALPSFWARARPASTASENVLVCSAQWRNFKFCSMQKTSYAPPPLRRRLR